MDGRLASWKEAADEFWSGDRFPFREAARLAAEIAGGAGHAGLTSAAKQALTSLRHAAAGGADGYRRSVARRRFGAVREILHGLTQPRFGRRTADAPVDADPARSTERQHRRRLGLPEQGRLGGPDIQAAYKRIAKRVHPDRGGDTQAFTLLVEARDALLGGIR